MSRRRLVVVVEEWRSDPLLVSLPSFFLYGAPNFFNSKPRSVCVWFLASLLITPRATSTFGHLTFETQKKTNRWLRKFSQSLRVSLLLLVMLGLMLNDALKFNFLLFFLVVLLVNDEKVAQDDTENISHVFCLLLLFCLPRTIQFSIYIEVCAQDFFARSR
mgnify:CR=1 FL=1